MIIRQEETRDYENIYSVVKKAFGSAVQADGMNRIWSMR